MARSEDQGDYFRVALDARALDYGIYVDRGEPREAELVEYDSNTTTQMSLEETEAMLLTLPEIQALLAGSSV
jgi:UDP-glucose 4-epimerase